MLTQIQVLYIYFSSSTNKLKYSNKYKYKYKYTVQQQCQFLDASGKDNNKNDESKQGTEGDKDDSKKATTKKESRGIPCTVYTFIKNKDMIPESVAECSDGLVNSVDKILQCVSQGYKTKISEYNLESMSKIYNIQSEEAGDLTFEFPIPKVDSENEE